MSLEQDALAEAPSPEMLARFPLNDLGNAQRLIMLCGGRFEGATVDTKDCTLLFLMGQGWIGFNGKHWDLKFGESLARRMAHQVHLKLNNKEMKDEIVKAHGLDFNKLRAFIDGLGDSGKTSSMLKQAESYLTVEIDDFDQHPMAINCRNWTLWLKADPKEKSGVKVVKKPHAAADRITRMIACDYDPGAKAPLFEGVVKRSLRDDDLRACFHRWLGYSLTGFVHEQAFAMCQGKGQDGKSTILDAVRELMGGYGEVGKVETFLDTGQQQASGAQPDLVKLSGDVRLVVLSEPPLQSKLNEGLIKQWTGSVPISARTLNRPLFDFRPIGKITFECNALPKIKGDDHGIWRRALIFLFLHQVPKDELDRTLPTKLRVEFAGILNWLICGVGDWLAQGLNPPEIVEKAKEDYRKQSSPFGDWLNECCVWGEEAKDERTASTALYNSYKDWVAEQGGDDKPMSQRSFGDALFQRQILLGPRLNDGKKTRKPIRLKSDAERYAGVTDSGEQAPQASATVGVGAPYAPPPIDNFDDLGAFDD